jgi:hypothetical protein
LESFCEDADGLVLDRAGLGYNPFKKEWSLLSGETLGSLEMNYIIAVQRK